MIPLLTRKLVYPYSLPKKIEDFDDINYFPHSSAFRDNLHDRDVDPNDYAYAKKVFDVSGCKSLRDLHDLYLLTDCSLLSDCWRSYNHEIFNAFGLHASNFISGPALSMATGLKKSKTDIELLSDESMYEIFQNSIKGGFCAVNQRYARANNVDMSSYDGDSETSMLFFKDFNSLYGECLTEKMPFKCFKYVDETSISLYQNNPKLFMEIDAEDDTGYFVTCDFDIPDHLARFTDMMPLSIVNTTRITPSPYTISVGGDKASQKKLIAGHFSLQNYSFHIKLLQLYISLGVVITKVHSMIEFAQKALFKDFVEFCANERRMATLNNDPNKRRQYKLLPNSLYGKSLQDTMFHNTRTLLTFNGPNYRKLVGSFRFKSRRWLIKDQIALVTLYKSRVKCKTPIFIGSCVLQLAKLKNLSYVHLVMQPSCAEFNGMTVIRESDRAIIEQSREFIKCVYIIYVDTDSILAHMILTEKAKGFTHVDLIQNTFLGKYMDCSNFKQAPPALLDICTPGQLGYLKSEVGCDIIYEVVALAAKLYSILSVEKSNGQIHTKAAVKGCPTHVAKTIYNHQTFLDMLFKVGYQTPTAVSNHIRRDKNTGVNTVTVEKKCLSLIENKRYWSSWNVSLGWGHPDIPARDYKPGYIIADAGAIVKGSIPHEQDPFQTHTISAVTPTMQPVDTDMLNSTTLSHIADSSNSELPFDLNGSYSESGDFFDVTVDGGDDGSGDITYYNEFDMYDDSNFEDYNLIDDKHHHVIKKRYDYVNSNVDEQDFVVYKKASI